MICNFIRSDQTRTHKQCGPLSLPVYVAPFNLIFWYSGGVIEGGGQNIYRVRAELELLCLCLCLCTDMCTVATGDERFKEWARSDQTTSSCIQSTTRWAIDRQTDRFVSRTKSVTSRKSSITILASSLY